MAEAGGEPKKALSPAKIYCHKCNSRAKDGEELLSCDKHPTRTNKNRILYWHPRDCEYGNAPANGRFEEAFGKNWECLDEDKKETSFIKKCPMVRRSLYIIFHRI